MEDIVLMRLQRSSEQAFQKVTEGTKDAKIKVSKKYGKVQKDEQGIPSIVKNETKTSDVKKDVPVSTIPNAVQDTVPST
mgnify:CR=1 FL=1